MAITARKMPDGSFTFSGRAFQITQAKNAALEPYGKQVHEYGLLLELLPTQAQAEKIRQTIGCARVVRNDFLQKRIDSYMADKSTLSLATYKKENLPALKAEKPWLTEVDKFALESAVEHVDAAYQNFFSGRAAFPRFASKYKPNGSVYTTKQTNGNIDIVLGKDGLPYLKLPKVGLVRFVLPKKTTIADIRPSGTSILKATIRFSGDRYYAALGMEAVIDKVVPVKYAEGMSITGIDMGLRDFCHYGTLENKETVANPRWIKLHEKRLRRFQKAMSRKQYDQKAHTGSRNWEKAKAKVTKEQAKTRNQRKDFHHKLSRKIADSCDIFVCEDLNIKGMMKNGHLAKAVASVGWGQFLTFVQYKLERKGGLFLKADRWFASSQICSKCGYQNHDVKDTNIREWTCPSCGAVHQRDDNAIDNLIHYAIHMLREQKACA